MIRATASRGGKFGQSRADIDEIVDEDEAVRAPHLIGKFIDKRKQEFDRVAHGRAQVADQNEAGLLVPLAKLRLHRHAAVTHVFADRLARVELTRFGALLP